MREDTGTPDDGPIDLSGVSLRELSSLPGSVLDRELARLLDRGSRSEKAAGFQNRA